MPRYRRDRTRGAAVAALVLALVGAPVAQAQVPDEDLAEAQAEASQAQREAEEARSRASTAAAQVDELDTRARRVTDQLLALRDQVSDAEARLRAVEGRLALAADELARREDALTTRRAEEVVARRAAEDAASRLAAQDAALADQVAAAYMLGGDPTPALFLGLLTAAETPGDLAVGMEQLAAAAGYQRQVVDEATDLRQERQVLVTAARDTRRGAAQAQQEADEAVAFQQSARDQQAAVTAQLEAVEEERAAVLAELEEDRGRAEVVLAAVDSAVAAAEADVRSANAAVDAAAAAAALGDLSGAVLAGARCPVVGAVAGRDFSNDWGDPRSGGRRHEGTDVFGARGTPLVAIADGTVRSVRRDDTGLGGRVVSIDTDASTYWYYAHLETVAPGLEAGTPVSEGQVIGTVGDSGNARGTSPHLHIGVYVSGQPVNPYPTLAGRCR